MAEGFSQDLQYATISVKTHIQLHNRLNNLFQFTHPKHQYILKKHLRIIATTKLDLLVV